MKALAPQLLAPLLALGCTTDPQPSDAGSAGSAEDTETDSAESGTTDAATSDETDATADATGSGATTGTPGTAGETSAQTEGETAGESGDSGDSDATRGEDGTTTGDSTLPPDFPTDCAPDGCPVWIEGGGYSTLQGAIDGAAAGEAVYVCPGTYEESLLVERSVEIIGAGQDLVTVDGGGAANVLDVDPADAQLDNLIHIRGLTLRGGQVGLRADRVVLSLEAMHVTDCTERGMSFNIVNAELDEVAITEVTSTIDGAGMYISGGAVSLTDSVIEDNTTTADGGGMYIREVDVVVTGGQVRRNTAARGGGAYIEQSSLQQPASLTVVNSDWGTGELQENEDEDVWCSEIFQLVGDQVSTWLGDDVSATCSTNAGGDYTCCEET